MKLKSLAGVIAVLGMLMLFIGTGCGAKNRCETDADCPGGETCELCGNSNLVVLVCSGAIDPEGNCNI